MGASVSGGWWGGARRSPPAPSRTRLTLLTAVVVLAHLAPLALRGTATRSGTPHGAATAVQVRSVTAVNTATAEPLPEADATPEARTPSPEAAPRDLTAVPPPTPASSPAASFGDDRYWPRSALSRAPVAQSSVVLPYPDSAPGGWYRAELSLFIDTDGRVQRVRVDTPGLPPPLEDAARQAFLAAPFQPGEIDGLPVRARMRVEVEFSTEEAVQTRGER